MNGCGSSGSSKWALVGVLVLTCAMWIPARSQWLATGAPMGGAVVSLATDSQYVYAGTTQGKVWRRPRSEFVTAVRVWTTPAGEVPRATLLNYPNPCNASTLFRCTLARAGGATLRLYDMLGRHVLTVLDRPLAAGEHQWPADLSSLPTGVYLAVFNAFEVSATSRVVLIR
jgi:hypothetical protein